MLASDVIIVPEPLIVVEVLSPSNAATDTGRKLKGYVRVPSILHDLVIDPDDRVVMHHTRGGKKRIITTLIEDGIIRLDPPGLAFAHASLFPPA